MRKAVIAAVLSFIIPGLGQLYNRDVARALVWFVVALVFDLGTVGLTAGVAPLVFHALCAWAAYSRAEEKSRRRWF